MATSVSNYVAEERRKNPAEKLVDVYQGRLPNSIKDVFKVAKALVVGNEIIAPVINKLAETPVTTILISSKNKDDEGDHTAEAELGKIMGKEYLGAHSFLKGISFNLYGYSNAFASLYFAPKRYLKCPSCSKKKANKNKGAVKGKGGNYTPGEKSRWLMHKIEWKGKIVSSQKNRAINDIQFSGKCPSCKKEVVFEREDVTYHTKKSLRLINWDPFYIDITHYRAIGTSDYYYRFSESERKQVTGMDRTVMAEYPWPYIQAALNKRMLKIQKRGFYHFKLDGISGVYDGWGTPRILAVLTALYTVMAITKANEATAEGRINDLTIISPQPNSRGEDPVGSMSLQDWMAKTKGVLEKFRKDKTVTAFMPFPVKAETVYGNGKFQLVSAELQLYIRNIVAAIGLPEDVIFSGGNYTSIAVAGRILANQASNMRKEYNSFLTFIKDTLSNSLTNTDFSSQKAELEPYESTDDFQKTNSMIQMAMGNRFPWGLIYKRFGTSMDEVEQMLKKEAKSFGDIAKIQAESEGRSASSMSAIQEYFRMAQMAEMAKWQNLQQNGDNSGAKKQTAESMAQSIMQGYSPDSWGTVVQSIISKDPELGGMVAAILQSNAGEPQGANQSQLQEPDQPQADQGQGNPNAVAQIGKNAEMPDKRAPSAQQKL